VARAKQLYSLPAVAVKVLELTDNPKVDTHALKDCIEIDPALSTKVLRVVNSSLFGLRREVSDLNQALALLGTKPLKLLVLGFSLPGALFAGVAGSTLGWYWRRTLTKAVAAREISEAVWHRAGDEPFIAGLLQDLGMLLLIQELGAPYVDFLEKVRQHRYDLLALEAASMGFNHTALTHALLSHWRLPESLVGAVLWRPDVESDPAGAPPHGDLSGIVQLAEWIARLLADGRPEVLGQVLSAGWQQCRLTPEQLGSLVEALEAKVRNLADVLSLQLPEGTDYREILAEAHARMSDVAMDVAEELVQRAQSDGGVRASSLPLCDEMQSLSAAAARLVQRPPESAASAIPARPSPAAAVSESPSAALEPVACEARPANTQADGGLLGQLAVAVAACRQSRCPLSLLLVELGQTDELVLAHGLHGFRELRSIVEKACRAMDHRYATCLPYGEAGFALVLVDCDRQMAVRQGNRLIARVARWVSGPGTGRHAGSCIGVGAATVSLPPKNFPAKDLLVAANRCVYGSRASGGGVVKSIEIY
jgi:HD-like signal output (HDOD) protein